MKLANKVLEMLGDYNGKEMGHNGEAGDTSMNMDHYHKTMIDAKGNGRTIHTMPYPGDESRKDDHIHEIVNWEVQEAEGHTHKIIS
jgi:hypothetical protein